MKDSYFTRTPRITTQAQMAEVLAARSSKRLAGDRSSVTTEDSLGQAGESSGPAPLPPDLPPATAPNRTDSQNAVRQSLEWDEPVRHGDGSGYQLSTDARWSVVKERLSATEWIYRVFKRSPRHLIVASAKTAQAAREAAQRHADEQK